MVFRSRSFKSSGTEKPKVAEILANISTCFTVSIPRSASRSSPSSSISAAYPVCSAIMALIRFNMPVASTGSASTDSAAVAGTGRLISAGAAEGIGMAIGFVTGASTLAGCVVFMGRDSPPATAQRVLSITLTSGCPAPVISFNHI